MRKEKYRLQNNRGIYLLPNLLTTTALFAGFFAIISGMNGYFETAAIAIFIAMVMDGLDGRVARLTNTATPFGSEYDSLSDMVCFGIAPSLVLYNWTLNELGKFGWLCAFVYTACCALRLARFNTQIDVADKRYFQGLSSTAAAGLIAGMVWAGSNYLYINKILVVFTALILLSMAILMVSNVRYHSFKQIDVSGKIRFVSVTFIIVVFVLISINPPWMLFSLFLFYALSGPIATLYNMQKTKKMRRKRLEEEMKISIDSNTQ